MHNEILEKLFTYATQDKSQKTPTTPVKVYL